MGKSDDSPVTVADFGAQAIVAYTLDQAGLPQTQKISLVAEESSTTLQGEGSKEMRKRIAELVNKFIPDDDPELTEIDVMDLIDMGLSQGGGSGMHWVLDPIDGTRGFVSNRQYAICLGLLVDGEAVMGVLGCPNMPRRKIIHTDGDPVAAAELESRGDDVGCIIGGDGETGAYVMGLWTDDAPKERIAVDTKTAREEIRFMESFESRHSDREITQRLAKALGINRVPLRLDSQAKYGVLSRGDVGLYMRFPPMGYREKIWDHCAGAVIVEAAGGKITDISGNRLDFSQGRFLDIDTGIIATNPELHSNLISLHQSNRTRT